MKYIPTIGLEIHAELATKSKMFCSCVNNPDEDKPNTNICPICMGHPGTLPVLNHEAIRHVLKVGLAVGGKLADFTEWDRKNYFYPDIPKGYQISQYKYPLVEGGVINGVAITRIHLEEDTGQSTHDAHVSKSLVNFNRAGVPLMELVTEPVIRSAATAVAFAKELQLLLRALGAGTANMEKGELRVEANVSVASEEDTNAGKFGVKTEVKNLNSFRAVERAIAYEIDRQTRAIERGQTFIQETRGWDENTGKTFSQRTKESSHDYRYFPDPDIPKMKLSELSEFAPKTLRKELPELPWILRTRLVADFSMTGKEAAVFVESPKLFDYFRKVMEEISATTNNVHDVEKKIVRLVINYLLSDFVGLLKKEYLKNNDGDIAYVYFDHLSDISAENFAKLIMLVADGKINSRGAKDILALLLKKPKDGSNDPYLIAEKNGFIQKTDENELKKMIMKITAANPTVIADYKKGKISALQFLIGQGMKVSRGSANPEILKRLFIETLDKI
jgi:aspartyl-tRNA(Asn)/glutamyl-tRNA(Gln) amidotransferase subunit B